MLWPPSSPILNALRIYEASSERNYIKVASNTQARTACGKPLRSVAQLFKD